MPVQVKWSVEAVRNLRHIQSFHRINYGFQEAQKLTERIDKKVDFIADHPLTERAVDNMEKEYRAGMVGKTRYKIYYKIMRGGHVKIIMIHHTSRKPPTPDELREAAKR